MSECFGCGCDLTDDSIYESEEDDEFCFECYNLFYDECTHCGWEQPTDELELNFKQELVCWRCNE